jgi:hypothetical protein
MPTISNIPQIYETEGSHGEEPLYSQGLCDKCQNVIDQVGNKEKGETESLPFYQDSLLVEHSAEKGCLLCGQFLALIETKQLEEPVHFYGIKLYRAGIDSDDADGSYGHYREQPNWVGYKIYLNTGDKSPYNLDVFLDRQCGRRVFCF